MHIKPRSMAISLTGEALRQRTYQRASGRTGLDGCWVGGEHGQIGGLCTGLITPLNRVSSHNKGFIISCWKGYCSLGTCVALLPARRPKNVGQLRSSRKFQKTTNPLCRPIKKPVFCRKCYLSQTRAGLGLPFKLACYR